MGGLYGFWQNSKILNDLVRLNSLTGAPFEISHGMLQHVLPILFGQSILLEILFNEVVAYNLFCVLGITFSALTVSWLVYGLTKSGWIGLFSGIVYGFSPNLISQTLAGHLGNAHAQWIVLYVFCLWKYLEQSTLKNGILTGFLFAVTVLSYTYYGYFAFFFSLIFIGYRFLVFERRDRTVFKKGMGILGILFVSFLVSIPFIYKAILGMFHFIPVSEHEQVGLVRNYHDVFSYAARCWDYFVPSELHPIFGSFSERISNKLGGRHFFERTLYLGVIPLSLAGYGIFRWWKERKSLPKEKSFFLSAMMVCGIGMMIFSFPPEIDLKFIKLYMPSHLLYKFFPMFRVYARAGVFVSLSVTVLAGWGLKCLLEKFSRIQMRIVCFSFLLLGLVFEYTLVPPIRNVDVSTVPPVYQWLGQQSGGIMIAEYPIFGADDKRHYQYLSYQRFHAKRMMNGAPDKTPPGWLLKSNRNLWEPEVTERLASLGIKYAIFHKEFYRKNIYERFLKASGLKLVKDFPEAFVFEIVAEPKDLTWVSMNAYLPEKGLGEKEWAWFSGNGGFAFYRRESGKCVYQLKFLLTSSLVKRAVTIGFQNQLLGEWEIEPDKIKEIVLRNIEFAQGLNVIDLKCEPGVNKKEKSVAFSGLQILARES